MKSTALTPIDQIPSSPVPTWNGTEMTRALKAYRELQHALDTALPDAIVVIQGKAFRTKAYWKAVSTAFNLTVELVREERVVHGEFRDGQPNFGYLVTYQAKTAAGRVAVGDGACFALEKTRRGAADRWHELPREASEHNVRSHAHTRAANRAVSNLVAFGEVSFEEVERDDDGPPPMRDEGSPAPPVNPKRRPDQEPINEGQRRKLFAEATRCQWNRDQVKAMLREKFGIESTSELRSGDLEETLRLIRRGPPVSTDGAT